MILVAFWLVATYGVHGFGMSILLHLAAAVILDDRLARREMARFDAMPGRWTG